jgi:hypothetical protein
MVARFGNKRHFGCTVREWPLFADFVEKLGNRATAKIPLLRPARHFNC